MFICAKVLAKLRRKIGHIQQVILNICKNEIAFFLPTAKKKLVLIIY